MSRVFLPKNKCYTSGGRRIAKYHFYGFKVPHEFCVCEDCEEVTSMINELCEVDSKYRREWMKLTARFARVPQRALLHVKYRRKHGNRF